MPQGMSHQQPLKNANHPIWYWVTLIFTALSMSIILFGPDVPIFRYTRLIVGVIIILVLPGYVFMRAFFPYRVNDDSHHQLRLWERIGFSLILSLVIAPILGFILNYSPWGISLTPITILLSLFIITFASIALIREERAKGT